MAISIFANPTVLIEEDMTEVTITLTSSEPIPADGLIVAIDSPTENALGQFDVFAARFVNGRFTRVNDDTSGFDFLIEASPASITVPIFDDNDDDAQDLTFNVLPGQGYTVDSSAGSVTLSLQDAEGAEPVEPTVSFSATPTIISEADGTALVMNFNVTGDIPSDGITVKLEGNAARIMQQFIAAQTRFNDDGETFNRFDKGLVNPDNNFVVGGTLELFSLEDGDPSETASNPEAAGEAYLTDFTFTITEPNASITIPVFDDLIQEMDQTFTYTLVDGDGYMVDDTNNSATFTVTDGVMAGVGPTVGVSASPNILFESQRTAVTLTFTTDGNIPPEGVVVVLEGPPRSITEFDITATDPRNSESETEVQGLQVTGGNIVGTNEVVGGLLFRITDPTATITVPVFQDDMEEGTENFTFNLRDGEMYNVDQQASSVNITIEDVQTPTVSFSATPTIISEAEGTALVMNFSVEGDIPEDGITVKLEGDAARIMQQFTAAQTRFNDSGETFNRFDKGLVNPENNFVVGGTLELFSLEDGDPSETASNPEAAGDAYLTNFTFTITEPNASITIPVFDDLIEEMDQTFTYTLVEGDGYMVDDTANSATFTVTDGVMAGVGPTVGVSATPNILFESERTAVTLTFTTDGDIPPEGVVVVLEGPPRSITEFDITATDPRNSESETEVQGLQVTGGNIVGTNEVVGGLLFRITDPTATITVPVFQDDMEEGTENFTFNLRDGEMYNVDQDASSVNITIEDIRKPTVSFSATPTIISEADGTELVMNFSVDGDIPEDGITVKLEGNAARIMQQFTAAQTRFNDAGEIFNRFDKGLVNPENNFVVGGTLELFSLEDGDPSETASNPEAAGDAFLSNFSFTITEPNASITIPVFDDLIQEMDVTYTYTLVEGDGYKVDDTANSATFTVTDGVMGDDGPTVGVSATPTMLVESDQTALTLTFTTEGEIPPEGVVVVLEGPPRSIAEFDINATNPRLPESETVVTGLEVEGGNIVGTNEVVGGLLFRITEPTATITVPVFQDLEQEGTENFTFNLRDGELYNVDANASSVSFTIEDGFTPPAIEVVQENDNGELTGFAYSISGVAAGQEAKVSISEDILELSDAEFDNYVGFYEVVDGDGGVDTDGDGIADFNPGDEGYAKAALENAVEGFALRVGGDTSDNTRASEFDAVVQGGKFYAPFAIANAGDMTVADFLAANPDNDAATSIDDQVAYFAFGEANPDGAIHLQSRGNGIYGFEDLPSNLGVSDNDFNDAVFKFDFTA